MLDSCWQAWDDCTEDEQSVRQRLEKMCVKEGLLRRKAVRPASLNAYQHVLNSRSSHQLIVISVQFQQAVSASVHLNQCARC